METGVTTTTTETGLETSSQADQRKQFIKELESFTKSLNLTPNPVKVQQHQGYDYIPISTIEKDLDKVYFGLVQYEVIDYKQIFNEVACHARIKVFHPILRQWLHYDGLGAAVIQQDANTKVADFMLHKKANAGQLTFPKAYAEAIKNAAKKIGKRFGSDLNRKFEDNYIGFIKDEADPNNKPLNR